MKWATKFVDAVVVINTVITLGVMLAVFIVALVVPYFISPWAYIIGIPVAGIALHIIADVVETIWG